jgi:hypothetical protein
VKRECYTLCCTEGQTEQALRVGGRYAAKLVRIIGTRRRDARERVGDPGRLVSLSSERDRGQVWRIGFDQQSVARHETEQFGIRPLLESHDSAERHVPTRGDGVLCQGVRPGVAVQDADHADRLGFSDERPGVALRLPAVHNYWPLHLSGQTYLSGERGVLRLARRIVVVVIEAALADRDGGAQELAQPRNVALFVESGGVMRMDSRRREHKARIPYRVFRRERRRLKRLSDADDSRRARAAGACDYRVAVAGERRVGEVGMAVDED